MIQHHNHSDCSEKTQRCQDYIQALEEERKKIQVFQRELPLCLALVTQAIETCKQQLSRTSTEDNLLQEHSECSEQRTSEGPVFEEFIPLKRSLSYSDDEDQQSHKPKIKNGDKSSKKSDWLRSAQLWNLTPDPPPKEDSPRKVSVADVKRNDADSPFHPFKKVKSIKTDVAKIAIEPSAPGSVAENVGGSKKEEREGQSQRKPRRCWSPELHRRFLEALQQLGGPHVATPKQIKELMKVDGLTNDEVKSHLQKYRLHTRRPSTSMHSNNNPHAPQFVVVGGIWVPPPEYSAMASTISSGEVASTTKGIHAPVASLPLPFYGKSASSQSRHGLHPDDQGSHRERHVRYHSPSTSSSTHTTTDSPVIC